MIVVVAGLSDLQSTAQQRAGRLAQLLEAGKPGNRQAGGVLGEARFISGQHLGPPLLPFAAVAGKAEPPPGYRPAQTARVEQHRHALLWVPAWSRWAGFAGACSSPDSPAARAQKTATPRRPGARAP